MAKAITKNQAYTILSKIYKEASGVQAVSVPTDSASFISLAQTTFDLGTDVVLKSITAIMNKTLFKEKSYSAKFNDIEMDSQTFGFYTRMLKVVDSDFDKEMGFSDEVITNGQSIDMYTIKKRDVVQLVFTGSNVFKDHFTIYDRQFNSVFNSPEELATFWAMINTNARNKFEQAKENLKRATLVNFMASKVEMDKTEATQLHVVHLLTEYNKLTGKALTIDNVHSAEEYPAFVKWMYSRISNISDLMTERSALFQKQIDDKPILDFVSKDEQKLYLHSQELNYIDSMVKGDVFHKEVLDKLSFEPVSYWQSIQDPKLISVKATYIDSKGVQIKQPTEVNTSLVVGCIMDKSAIGMTTFNDSVELTPHNASGMYYNQYYHADFRYMTDFTAKGCVFVLD